MPDFTRRTGLYYLLWNDWVALGERRSATGFLAEWLETSPRTDKSILVNSESNQNDQRIVPGLLACGPDTTTGYLKEIVSNVNSGQSVVALFPGADLAEEIIDCIDSETADLCLTLWPGDDQLEMWLEAHGATQLPSGLPTDLSFIDRLDPDIRITLKRSIKTRNKQNRINHGSGMEEVLQTLEQRHKNGYEYDVRGLQVYAYRLGYRQSDVQQLGRFLNSIDDNRL